MAEPPSLLDPQAVFQSTLLDASGQPNLIIDSAQRARADLDTGQ